MEQNQDQSQCDQKYLPSPNGFLPRWLFGGRGKKKKKGLLLTHALQTQTHTYKDTSRGVSSPTALLLGGEVDLEVVRVVVDVQETAALVKLADASVTRGEDE